MAQGSSPPGPPDSVGGGSRSIRVFVSSTFRDMQAEREELVKRVFPVIRRLCESRGATFAEIDLRWGVTDEQKAEGAVLPLCLAEIDRSRPYFIGMLGQRYGWVPDQISADLVQQIGWLPSAAGKSVTELEIIHGVLHDPGAARHAYFYLRDPAWTRAQPASIRDGLVDGDAALGPMLDDLRARVRGSGLPVADYTDARSLGEQVLADLTALVDARFPAGTQPSQRERDDAAHAAFAHVHGDLALPRPGEQAQLDAHGSGSGPALLITGQPGSGGEGQAALWAARWRRAHPDCVVIEHHVEAGAQASDPTAMQSRLLSALRDAASGVLRADEPAQDPLALREQWFSAVAAWGAAPLTAVLVVTGAHLLDDVLGAPDLTWLPPALPPNLRVVIAAEGCRPSAAADRLGLAVLQLADFPVEARPQLAMQYLARFSKGLDSHHLQRIADAPGTGNELYLRTVLDELRQHGDHFTIGALLDHYLAAGAVDDLLELVFARYEQDFEGDRPGLIGDAFRALHAARRGIAESELLELLSSDAAAGPLPRAVWTPAFLACEGALVERGGMLSLASEIHRTAVRDRYLPTPESEAAAHAVLARYFAASAAGARRFDELPWQQLGAGDIPGLTATLSDLSMLPAAYAHDAAALRRLWARAEAQGASIVAAFAPVLGDPAAHPSVSWEVARLVTDAGHPREALALNHFLVRSLRSDPSQQPRYRAAQLNLGAALWMQGDLPGADEALSLAIAEASAAGDNSVLIPATGNLALVRRDRGDSASALLLFDQEEAMLRARGSISGLLSNLGNRADLVRMRGDYDGALALMREQESLARSIGDSIGVARALGAQAAILSDRGDAAGALAAFVAHGAASREAGDLRGQAESLINQSHSLRETGDLTAAETAAVEGQQIALRLGDQPLTARALDARARRASATGDWHATLQLGEEAVLTARSGGAPAAIAATLSIVGTAARELGDLARARTAHEEERALCSSLNDPIGAARSDVNMGHVLVASNDLPGALGRYEAADAVLRPAQVDLLLWPLYSTRWQVRYQGGDAMGAIADLLDGADSAGRIAQGESRTQLLSQASAMLTQIIQQLYSTGRGPESAPVWADLARACRGLGDENGLQRALGERALLLLRGGAGAANAADNQVAGELLTEQEAICRRTGNTVGLVAAVGNRAIALRGAGDLPGALACLEEQLQLARSIGDANGAVIATANRGDVLGAMGRRDEAVAALNEARQLAVQAGQTPMLAQLDQMIAALRAGA